MPTPSGRASIALVINSLEGGGAERIMSLLAARLAERGRPVRLVTLDRIEDRYALPSGLKRHRLDSGGGLARSVSALRRFVREHRPDLLLSFLTRANVASVFCGRTQDTPCIVSERVHTSSHFADRRLAAIDRLMVRAAYPLADRVVAVSHGVKADLVSHYGVPSERVETIHNPVDAERLADAAAEAPTIDLPADFFVAAGRLFRARTSRCWCAPSRPPGSRTISSSSAKGRSGRSSKRSRADSGFPAASTFRDMPETRTPSSQGRAPTSRRRTRKAFRTPSSKRWLSAARSSRWIVQPDPPRFSASRKSTAAPGGFRRAPHGVLVPMNDVWAMSAALRAMTDPAFADPLAARALERVRDFGVDGAVDAYEAAIDRVLSDRKRTRT